MRVLVTGAGGFVGRSLIPHLLQQGHQVVAATRSQQATAGVTRVQISTIGPETDWSKTIRDVDAVVHLAARAHILRDKAPDRLAEHRRVNTQGTTRLAREAEIHGVKRFIFMSSIGVLGSNSLKSKNGKSFTEDDDPNPHDDYSRSKWEAEQELIKMKGLDLTIIRPSLVYGPRVTGNLSRLIGLAQKGRPFPLGAIDNNRSLLGVGNLASFVSCCLQHQQAIGKTYVLADSETTSTAGLYEFICQQLGVHSRLVNLPEFLLRGLLRAVGKGKLVERLCDTLVVDASYARKDLGWSQPLSQDRGLKEMVEDAKRALQ